MRQAVSGHPTHKLRPVHQRWYMPNPTKVSTGAANNTAKMMRRQVRIKVFSSPPIKELVSTCFARLPWASHMPLLRRMRPVFVALELLDFKQAPAREPTPGGLG